MKLVKANIHNFRGILDATFNLNEYSLIVGPNNAGKSTIIDAIRAFYEKDGFKFRPDRDQPMSTKQQCDSWVELTYELCDSELDSISDQYKRDDRILQLIKFMHLTEDSDFADKSIGVIYSRQANGEISNEQFYGAKNVQSGKIGDLIYIPAVSKIDDHTKLSGPSSLRDLLTDILTNVMDSNSVFAEFEEAVDRFASSISESQTKDARSINDFQDKLNELLHPWQTKFAIKFKSPKTDEIIKQMLAWEMIDKLHGQPVSIDNYGSGFQRHFIYSMIQLRASYAKQSRAKKSNDFCPELTLLLFEEPEAFLHPPQQEKLARILRDLGAAASLQVICTTHSSNFVSRKSDSLHSIVRVKRTNGISRTYQIDLDTWNEIVESNMKIMSISGVEKTSHPHDKLLPMESAKHFIWLSPDRSSAFFADHVLIVEGPTEVSLIVKLMDDDLIITDRTVHVLDGCGKFNQHRFIKLLSTLGIDHSVIYDDDNNKTFHPEIASLINKTSHPEFTYKIVEIPGETEKFLNIPPAGEDRRKPQNALYHYNTGSIDPHLIQNFCDLIMSCFPDSEASQQSAD